MLRSTLDPLEAARFGEVSTPARGDIIWLSFDPQAGREQGGRRPAVVISPVSYNLKVGLAICCPITSKSKGYPFEVALPDGLGITGVVLADQVKSLDWRTRQAEIVGRLPQVALEEVLAKIAALIQV